MRLDLRTSLAIVGTMFDTKRGGEEGEGVECGSGLHQAWGTVGVEGLINKSAIRGCRGGSRCQLKCAAHTLMVGSHVASTRLDSQLPTPSVGTSREGGAGARLCSHLVRAYLIRLDEDGVILLGRDDIVRGVPDAHLGGVALPAWGHRRLACHANALHLEDDRGHHIVRLLIALAVDFRGNSRRLTFAAKGYRGADRIDTPVRVEMFRGMGGRYMIEVSNYDRGVAIRREVYGLR